MDPVYTDFLNWFQLHKGTIAPCFSLHDFSQDGMGCGAIALSDIREGDLLFSIPRDLLFSISNCKLPVLVAPEEWKKVNKQWVGLILCMMWDYLENRERSFWKEYWDILPTTFDTPMFWPDDQLAELQGTGIEEKIGKKSATEAFENLVAPLVKSRCDVFRNTEAYTLDLYHRMGSLILSRGFDDTKGEDEEKNEEKEGDENGDVSMSYDDNDDDENDDDDEEDENNAIAMVPMADMLNAVSGGSNAILHYHATTLEMRATQDIPKGSQIFNTYADPSNGDLLRRYGHIDPNNPFDNVDIDVGLFAQVAEKKEKLRESKIDWCLENDLEDTFTFTMKSLEEGGGVKLSPDCVSILQILLASEKEFSAIKRKGTLPELDPNKIRKLIIDTVAKRESQYKTTIEQDEELLSQNLGKNVRNAVIVRLGEKKILRRMRESVLERMA